MERTAVNAAQMAVYAADYARTAGADVKPAPTNRASRRAAGQYVGGRTVAHRSRAHRTHRYAIRLRRDLAALAEKDNAND